MFANESIDAVFAWIPERGWIDGEWVEERQRGWLTEDKYVANGLSFGLRPP